MARELGGSQISALLESVPGIANVLRSPVADALVNAIRAGAGLEEFDLASAEELIQYAVRRGLIGASEGDEVLSEVKSVVKRGRKKPAAARKPARRAAAAKKAAKKKTGKKKPAKKAAKKTAAKKSSRSGRAKRR